jgi:tetratricopeptide (TPR) repeat protein
MRTHRIRADGYRISGDIDRAIADYGEAIRLNGKAPSAYFGRGSAFDVKGEPDKAIADYSQAILLKPDDAAAYNSRGAAYDDLGAYDKAIADYDEAIKLNSNYAAAYNNRGFAYHNKRMLDRAIADYRQALRADPGYILAYINRGNAYEAQRDHSRALADFDEAIRRKPEEASSYIGRARLHLLAGERAHAESDAGKAVSLDPAAPGIRDARGHILLALDQTEEALNDFNEALRRKPTTLGSLWGRAQIYERQGLRSFAFADYKRVLELGASQPADRDIQRKVRGRLAALEAAPLTSAPADPHVSVLPRPQVAMGRRAALVIGNSDYKAAGMLTNPRSDAAAVAATLGRLGFEVIERHDLGFDGMRRVLAEFEDLTAGADWALVYYAGHGMELSGKNWLIPIDAQLLRASDISDEAVALDRVLERLSAARKLRIVVLDACRNNPFTSKMVMNRVATRAVARGLSAVEPSHGEVVFFAARDGNVALDGQGRNSPFALALVKHMEEEGVELGRLFRKVTSSVLEATQNWQEPFVYGRLPDEDYYLKPPK